MHLIFSAAKFNEVSVYMKREPLNTYRASNYELLRMMAGVAVIVLHFNFHPNGGGALTSATGANYYFLLVMEVTCACAVNVFILISGYFGCNSRTVKTGKLAELLLQTICFGLSFYLISGIKSGNVTIRSIFSSMIPANYFVMLYIALMCVAPFINKLLSELNSKQFTILVSVILAVFSAYSTMVDVFKELTNRDWNGLSSIGLEGSMRGYTIVNFILIYILGAWLKKDSTIISLKTRSLVAALVGIIAIGLIWYQFLPKTALMYSNPLIIAEAIVVFALSGKIQIQSNFINRVAPATFTCFLIQSKLLGIIVKLAENMKTLPRLILLLLGSVVGIYIVAFITMELWKLVMRCIGKYTVYKIPTIDIDKF